MRSGSFEINKITSAGNLPISLSALLNAKCIFTQKNTFNKKCNILHIRFATAVYTEQDFIRGSAVHVKINLGKRFSTTVQCNVSCFLDMYQTAVPLHNQQGNHLRQV